MRSIQWTDVTWNPVRGCSRISDGCRNCYAEKIAARFSDSGKPFDGFASRNPSRWTGRVELIPEKLGEPLRWRKPRRVFVNSMSDLFHESLSDEDIDRVFGVIAWNARHTFQILTKRAGRMRDYLGSYKTAERLMNLAPAVGGAVTAQWKDDALHGFLFPNIWLGVSCEDQKTADERIPLLLQTPAAVRFVSLEPLLGPIDLGAFVVDPGESHYACCTDSDQCPCRNCQEGKANWLDWVIVGGESGPGARPCDVAWIRDIVRQCKTAGVACFVKQLGAKPTGEAWASNRRFSPLTRDRKGGEPLEWPEDLRVREFPGVAS